MEFVSGSKGVEVLTVEFWEIRANSN